MKKPAIVITDSNFCTPHGKTAHGLIRGSHRFLITAVVDRANAGNDAGELLDGTPRNIPVVATVREALNLLPPKGGYCLVGSATHGGCLTSQMRCLLREAVRAGLSVVNGLHEYVSDDPGIAAIANQNGVKLVDLRKPRRKQDLHFWTGKIRSVLTPRIAVLGMDCAIGKRTTCKLLTDACNKAGIKTEMIYTGQTGWMQGAGYGFILDSVVNDFVSGEIEHAIVSCEKERKPDLITVEGQSSLQHPCGPCGPEILLSGEVHGVILQHSPARKYYEGYEKEGLRIGPLEDAVKLIELYKARTLAVTLTPEGLKPGELEKTAARLGNELQVPVFDPLRSPDKLVRVARDYIHHERANQKRGIC